MSKNTNHPLAPLIRYIAIRNRSLGIIIKRNNPKNFRKGVHGFCSWWGRQSAQFHWFFDNGGRFWIIPSSHWMSNHQWPCSNLVAFCLGIYFPWQCTSVSILWLLTTLFLFLLSQILAAILLKKKRAQRIKGETLNRWAQGQKEKYIVTKWNSWPHRFFLSQVWPEESCLNGWFFF